MTEHAFEGSPAIQLAGTPKTGRHMSGFSAWLREVGYAPRSIVEFERAAAHIEVWCDRNRRSLDAFGEAAVSDFCSHLPKCSCHGLPVPPFNRRAGTHARRFVQYLRAHGIAAPPRGREPHPLRAGFEAWMRQHRSVSSRTLVVYGRIITSAINALGDDPTTFEVSAVREFILEQSRVYGRSQTKLVMTATRAFLRYLVARGACRPGIDAAVPTIAGWRLASLPRYLSAPDIERVIGTCDSSSATGIRNRAMLLLMARLALRCSDVAALRLGDVDWQQATVAVSGKSRRATCLPLPQDVGDALLAYLPYRLPKDSCERFFLRLRPPHGPITSTTAGTVAGEAIRAAGIVAPVRGAHVLRHSAATELLRQGASLEQVGLILRHRDPDTTRLYAKVDVELLRTIAQPWPEVTPC